MKRFFSEPGAAFGASFIFVLAAACFLAPGDPYTLHPEATYSAPSWGHWLGTDDLGRDVLSRLLVGGRVSLTIAIVGAAASVILGGSVGLTAGYFGGIWDAVVMRVTDAFMALPRLPFMILLLALELGDTWPLNTPSSRLVLIVVVFGWTTAARLSRASAQQIRGLPYVDAAIVSGVPPWTIVVRHVLRGAAGPLIVAATLDVGQIILYESVLSFLGLGVQPPVPSWGAMLKNGMTYLYTAPVLLVIPGFLTFLTVAAVQLTGDGLQKMVDVRSGEPA